MHYSTVTSNYNDTCEHEHRTFEAARKCAAKRNARARRLNKKKGHKFYPLVRPVKVR